MNAMRERLKHASVVMMRRAGMRAVVDVPTPGRRRAGSAHRARRRIAQTRGSSMRGGERQVGDRGHPPRAVGDDERDAERPDLLAELEQRARPRRRGADR